MKLSLDEVRGLMTLEDASGRRELPLYSDEAFRVLSKLYVKLNWNQKYTYTFSWMGRPIIQLPDDLVRIQEVISRVEPDVIVETGVAHGGSLVLYASLCRALGRGRVVGVDIEIRPHNREAIEAHRLSSSITLIEGSSTADETFAAVRSLIKPGERVLVILDSNHSYAHVAEELRLYAPMVSVGSYIVATDGIMSEVADTPRGKPEWVRDNPTRAAEDFARGNADFALEQPAPGFEEGYAPDTLTHWPNAYLRRIR
jgi:cephalosporin hydroxylase